MKKKMKKIKNVKKIKILHFFCFCVFFFYFGIIQKNLPSNPAESSDCELAAHALSAPVRNAPMATSLRFFTKLCEGKKFHPLPGSRNLCQMAPADVNFPNRGSTQITNARARQYLRFWTRFSTRSEMQFSWIFFLSFFLPTKFLLIPWRCWEEKDGRRFAFNIWKRKGDLEGFELLFPMSVYTRRPKALKQERCISSCTTELAKF